jgi:hypothetical protein
MSRFSDLSQIANLYLRKLEIGPVVQACGRNRFLTNPREVVFFQLNDLEGYFPNVQTFRTLGALRQEFGLVRARDFGRPSPADLAPQIRQLAQQGGSLRKIAAELGLSKSTVARILRGPPVNTEGV